MDLKDKLLIGGAVICAIIIFVVFAANKANSDPNDFVTGSYYTPKTTTKFGVNEGNSWSNFASGNKLECVGISNTSPQGTPISINGATKYKVIQYFPLTMEDMGLSTNVCTINTINSTLKPIDETGTTLGGCTSIQIPASTEHFEIVAPFSFSYDSSNIDENRDVISIVSSNRKIKLVFEGVENWFCAGPVGTQTVYKNAGEDLSCDWNEHSDHHATIIGYSKNAQITGGSAGDLIAYGSNATKMTLYVIENGQWSVKSWYGILKKH